MRPKLSESEIKSRKKLGERYNTARELQALKDRVAGLRIAINLLISEEKKIAKQIEQHQTEFRSTEVGLTLQSKMIVFQALDGGMIGSGIEKAASNESADALYENIVAHLDELSDSQPTAPIESVRAVQVERETEKILVEAV